MDYKEGFEKVKKLVTNQFIAHCNCKTLIDDTIRNCFGLIATEISLIESEITKTQQECDHCPKCGLKLR